VPLRLKFSTLSKMLSHYETVAEFIATQNPFGHLQPVKYIQILIFQ
jgi:hypothetical protein